MQTGRLIVAKFNVGEKVRVRDAHPMGHLRTPRYIMGKAGVVERICGEFGNPEDLAFGRDGTPKQSLYRVRFAQRDVWQGYDDGAADTVDVELYEHWLEPMAAKHGDAQ